MAIKLNVIFIPNNYKILRKIGQKNKKIPLRNNVIP